MTRILEASVVTLLLAASALVAQTTPPLQKGVSVQMAVTEHAQAMPDADSPNAWVVTILPNGALYFRANQTTPEELAEWMKSQPHNRDAKLYIKADALAPFENVRNILDAGRDAKFETVVLLTSQAVPPSPGALIPPMGIPVQVAPPANPDPVAVQVIKTSRPAPLLKINNQQIPAPTFASALTIVLQTQTDKTVLLRVQGVFPYSEIAHVMDQVRAAGGNIAMTESKQ